LKRAGLPYIRFHDLRHAVATLLLVDHHDLKHVSAALRHTHVAVTALIYGHTTEAMSATTANAVEDIMQRARGEKERKRRTGEGD
jgi:integrase